MLTHRMNWLDVRATIRDACRALETQDLVSVASGNVSVRLTADDRNLIAITPSQIPLCDAWPEQVLVVDLEGAVVDGDGTPSSEMPAHLAVYRARTDVGAVVHTHSVYATALAVAGQDLPVVLDEQVIVLGGAVRVAEFGPSSSEELANNVVATLGDCQAALLRNHGAIAVGHDLAVAVAVAVLLERVAKTYSIANTIGTPQQVPDEVLPQQSEAFRKRCEG